MAKFKEKLMDMWLRFVASSKLIKATDLTPTELIELNIWQNELKSLAANSSSERIRNNPPKLLVKMSQSAKWQATASWGLILVSRDCLMPPPAPLAAGQPAMLTVGVPAIARRYLLAHELGHEEGLHPSITTVATFMMIVPVGFFNASTHHCALLAMLIILFVLGIAILVLQKTTMLFEWNADDRGAQMAGRQDMIDGATIVQTNRPQDQAAFYASKLDKLNGKRPSMRMP